MDGNIFSWVAVFFGGNSGVEFWFSEVFFSEQVAGVVGKPEVGAS